MWHFEQNLPVCPSSVLVHHGAGLDLGLILLLLRPRGDPHVILGPGGDAPAEGHPVEAAGEEVGARVVRLGPRRAAHHPRVALPGTPGKGTRTLRQQVAFVFILVDGVLGAGYGGENTHQT